MHCLNPTIEFPNLNEWKEDTDESDDNEAEGEKSESDQDSSDHEEEKEQAQTYKGKKHQGKKYIIFKLFSCRQFVRKVKEPTGENLIKEKNEWGDYKVKALQIKQLAPTKHEDLNKSVS